MGSWFSSLRTPWKEKSYLNYDAMLMQEEIGLWIHLGIWKMIPEHYSSEVLKSVTILEGPKCFMKLNSYYTGSQPSLSSSKLKFEQFSILITLNPMKLFFSSSKSYYSAIIQSLPFSDISYSVRLFIYFYKPLAFCSMYIF